MLAALGVLGAPDEVFGAGTGGTVGVVAASFWSALLTSSASLKRGSSSFFVLLSALRTLLLAVGFVLR